MREHEGKLADKSVKLAATFKASIRLAKEVGDPLEIAREANLEALMLSQNIPYQPRWKFTVENVPKIIHIGMSEGGSNFTLEQVQELVFDAGFSEARSLCIEYLGLIIGPKSELESESEGESEGN